MEEQPQRQPAEASWDAFRLGKNENRIWWWCSADQDYVYEHSPGDWPMYRARGTMRLYWWKNDSKWFYRGSKK